MDQNDLESLLASLRQQQDAPAPTNAPPSRESHHPDHSTRPLAAVPSQDTLDALLSSLTALPDSTHAAAGDVSTSTPLTRTRDGSNLTFPESLPILHSLATDSEFLDRIEQLWDEQKNWELRMKDERNRLEQEAIRAGLK